MATISYNVTGIAPVSGDNFSTAFAINNNGEVVGVSYNATFQLPTGGTSQAPTLTDGNGFFYTGTTTVIPALGTSPKGLSIATPDALNDSGEIVGASTQTGFAAMAGFTDIGGVVALFDGGVPTGVNNSGAFVGSGSNSSFRANGTVVPLTGLTSVSPLAFGINNGGVTIGASGTNSSTNTAPNIHVVQWAADSTTPTDLGGLSGFAVNVGFAINTAGDAVGYGFNPVGATKSTTVNPTNQNGSIVLGLPQSLISTGEGSEFFNGQAMLYSAKTQKMTGLGDLGGGFSVAEAMNDSDEVVGMSLDSTGDYHAFLFNGTSMIDLNSLIPATSGWDLINADGINNAGDIVGYGDNDGLFEAFELTPNGTISGGGGGPPAVPLPSAFHSGLFLLITLGAVKTIRAAKAS